MLSAGRLDQFNGASAGSQTAQHPDVVEAGLGDDLRQLRAGVLACSGEPIEQEPDTKERGPHDRVLPAADVADEQRPLGNEDPAHLSQCVSLHGTRKVVKDQRTDDTVDGAVGEWNRIGVKIARPAAGT